MNFRIARCVLLLLTSAPASFASAQRITQARTAISESASGNRHLTGLATDSAARVLPRLGRLPLWSAPLASALLPGLGQARLGQERFIPYMALEAYLILQYAKNIGEVADNASTYRAIARDVARRGFPGSHPDTVWQYYEKMEKYDASGSFSISVNGKTGPEADAETYNGQQWILARQVYGISLDDPNPSARATYAQALAYYESRAIPLAYGWNWINASLEKDLFVQAINRRNDAYRRATTSLIVLIANHIVSSIDAFSSVRLLQSNGIIRASASIPLR